MFVVTFLFNENFQSFFSFQKRYPFDWRTPVGYLFAWIAQCLAVFGVMAVIPFFNIIFGSSWLFYVITDDIKNDVAAFNATLKTEKGNGDRSELIERFLNVIHCYSDVKQ